MKYFSILYLSIFSFFLSSQVLADDNQVWLAFSTKGPVKEDSKILAWFDGHTRFSDDAGRLGISIVRPGIGYKVSDNLSLWTGYAWVISEATGRENITDNRFWQQATYKIGEYSFGNLSGRTRFENRFFRSGDDTGFRLRQAFKWTKPLSESFYTSVWNETFIALNDVKFAETQGYDQNRTHVGFGWKFPDSFTLEAGYLFNHIRKEASDDLENNSFALSLSVPF